MWVIIQVAKIIKVIMCDMDMCEATVAICWMQQRLSERGLKWAQLRVSNYACWILIETRVIIHE